MSGTETTELYKFKNRVEYIKALDSILPESFKQSRDIGNGKKHYYYPVGIKEAVADDIFHEWNVVSEKYTQIGQTLISTVSVIYVPGYPGAVERHCTGSAAVLMQDKKNALEYQLPAVISEATGNALGKLGNIFGRNLSRKLNKDTVLPSDFTIRKTDNVEPEEKKVQEPEKKEAIKQQPAKQVINKVDLPF